MKRSCDYCNKEYSARKADIDRGWGLCCSKSCAASKREEAKPGYNKATVAMNNIRREVWNSPDNPRSENFREMSDDDYNETVHPFSTEGIGQDGEDW